MNSSVEKPKPPRGGLGWAWPSGLSVFLIFGVGGTLVALRQGWSSTFWLIVTVGATLFLLYVYVVVVGVMMARAARQLHAREPGALIIKTTRMEVFDQWYPLLTSEGVPRPPVFLYFVVNDLGISIYSGGPEFRRFLTVEWAQVESIAFAYVTSSGFRRRGLDVRVRQDEKTVDMLFVAIGSGFAGGFPPSRKGIEELIDAMLARRSRRQ